MGGMGGRKKNNLQSPLSILKWNKKKITFKDNKGQQEKLTKKEKKMN